jgi:hypothetical protein
MVHLANEAKPPLRFFAGAVAVKVADEKLTTIRAEIASWRQLSINTDANNNGNSNVEGLIRQLR